MQKIKVRDVEFNVIEINRGARETLVMVHGMFTNLSVFYLQIAPELSHDYHIVLYDLRSHGLSEWTDEGYTLNSMTEDMIAIMDKLEIPKAHLVGYSFGGLIALNSVLTYPERFDKLIVIEAPNPNDDNMRRLIDEQGLGYLDDGIAKYSRTTNIIPGARQRAKGQKLYEHLFMNPKIKSEMLSDRNFMDNKGLDEMKNHTLLLYANSSECLEAGKMLSTRIPTVTLKTCDGDHNIPVQQPKWISRELEAFINQ